MRRSRILWNYIYLSFFLSIFFVQCGGDSKQVSDDVSTLTLLYPGDETYFGHCVYGEPRYLMWAIFQKDHPVTFLRPNLWTYVAHKRVKGLRSPDRANPLLQMRHLWIEEDN